ncbi:MAG: hypothetical protein BWY16_00586 [Candidatus Omnitrophica bacterium ADurb.Bin205]|nr:MAG: hypothetical protein BWY16_00586 [Candidatus Omnitrophica bacterium ADurb.Bin205]
MGTFERRSLSWAADLALNDCSCTRWLTALIFSSPSARLPSMASLSSSCPAAIISVRICWRDFSYSAIASRYCGKVPTISGRERLLKLFLNTLSLFLNSSALPTGRDSFNSFGPGTVPSLVTFLASTGSDEASAGGARILILVAVWVITESTPAEATTPCLSSSGTVTVFTGVFPVKT